MLGDGVVLSNKFCSALGCTLLVLDEVATEANCNAIPYKGTGDMAIAVLGKVIDTLEMSEYLCHMTAGMAALLPHSMPDCELLDTGSGWVYSPTTTVEDEPKHLVHIEVSAIALGVCGSDLHIDVHLDIAVKAASWSENAGVECVLSWSVETKVVV